MSYFSNLPKIYYDYNIAGVNEVRIIADISANMRFNVNALKDITLFDEYDIHDGDTPEIVSERIYGSPLYHWVIMLMNERFDYINDWPLSMSQLQQHVTSTYGVGNEYNIHHWMDHNGRILTSTDKYYNPYTTTSKIFCNLSVDSNIVTSQIADLFNAIHTGLSYEVKGIGIEPNTYVNTINSLSSITISNLPNETILSELSFMAYIDPMIGATSVTNFDYEMDLNESKRRIKILHPTVLPSILVQLKDLTNV